MPTGTITVTEGGVTDVGIHAYARVLTGQAASPIGVTTGATNSTPSLTTGTGVTTGSWVYGAVLALAGTATANGATTKQNDAAGQGLEYLAVRSTGTMTGGSAVTIGVTGVTGISISLLEILAGAGLAEDASSPAAFGNNTITATSASFSPPTGSLIVVAVTSNGGAGVTTMGLSDTLGGLVWTEHSPQQTSGDGYCGMWSAPVPVPSVSAGILLAAGI